MSGQWPDIAYPWGPDLASFAEEKADPEVLKTSVSNIILTRFGQRCMRNSFGSAVPGALAQPNDDAMLAIVRSSAQTAIEQWDPRIVVIAIDAERRQNELDLKVVFRDKRDPTMSAQTAIVEFSALGAL